MRYQSLSLTLLCSTYGKIGGILSIKGSSYPELMDTISFDYIQVRDSSKIKNLQITSSPIELREQAFRLLNGLLILNSTKELIVEGDESSSSLFKPLSKILIAISKANSKFEARAFSTFYLLNLLKWSGLDPLEASVFFGESQKWLEEMEHTKIVSLPSNQNLIDRTLLEMINFYEKVTEKSVLIKKELFD